MQYFENVVNFIYLIRAIANQNLIQQEIKIRIFKAFFVTTQYLSVTNYKSTSFQSQKTSSSATARERKTRHVTTRLSSMCAGYYSVQSFPFPFCKKVNSQIRLRKFCVYLDLCDELCSDIKIVFGYMELRRSFVYKRDNRRLSCKDGLGPLCMLVKSFLF